MKTSLLIVVFSTLLFNVSFSQSIEPVNSAEIIKKGIQLHSEKKYKEAMETYKKVHRNDTNYVKSLYELAYSASMDSNFTESLRAIELGLSLDDDSNEEDFLALRASVADDMGDTEKAIRLYDSALLKYPNMLSLMLNKSISYIRVKKLDEAEAILKEILLRNPYYSSAHFRLGHCALQKGHMAKAMMSFFTYLVTHPSGPFQTNSINILSEISKNTEGVARLVENRKEDAGEGFSILEQILFSKIALDKNYKIRTEVDDPIIRQLQVMMEKLQYDPSNNDFWMQYYVPYLKSIFDNKHFEPAMNYAFSNVDIDLIKRYNKKNSKEISAFATATHEIFEKIRTTRELDYSKRLAMSPLYHYSDGNLIAKGELNKAEKMAGKWEFYYSNGNIKAIGSFNEKGEKTGKWTYYFENGGFTGHDNWANDLQHGEDLVYNRFGIVIEKAIYANGKLDGEHKTFYSTGQPKDIRYYKNGIEEGKLLEFYKSGKKKVEATVVNDEFHGPYFSFYENGLPEYEVLYENGKLTGDYKYYYENGNKKITCQYKNGEVDGELLNYHPGGIVSKRSVYINGIYDGQEIEYNSKGTVTSKGNYQKGKATGLWEYFGDDGILYSTFFYDKDVLKEAKYFDKKGNVISTSARKNKELELTVYAPEGYKVSHTWYNDKSEKLKTHTFFYSSGKVKEVNNYKNGMLDGVVIGYYPNGAKNYEVQYEEDKKNGASRIYYLNGKLKSEAWYTAGELNGHLIEYNLKGNITSTSTYLYDNIYGERRWNHANGRLNEIEEFRNEILHSNTQFDTTGKIINISTFSNGNGNYKGIHFNGKKSYTGAKLNGLANGKYYNYFFDESISLEKNYEQGNLNGPYIDYHYGGTPAIKGQYSNDEMTGNWKYYTRKGRLWKEINYVHGEIHGKMIIYHYSGSIENEMEYKNGQLDGAFTRYSEDGQIVYQLIFTENEVTGFTYSDKNGKLLPVTALPGGNGKILTYFKDGSTAAEMEYSDGELTGSYKLYHPGGKLYFQSTELFGNSDGKSIEYFRDGKLQSEYNYLLGELDGPYKVFHENGKLSEEGNYYLGDYNCGRKFYDETGKLIQTIEYYYGTIIKSTK
jgi:uncharacterized protein